MSLKRKIAFTGGGLLFFVLLLVILLAGIYFYLPYYLQSNIIPQLAAEAGISDFAVNIRHIGFFNADLGTLRIGRQENPALVVQSVQVDYSPRSLYQQKIEKITLSGIDLYGEISGGEFKLRGLEFQKLAASWQQQEKSKAASSDTAPWVTVKYLTIRNSQIIISYEDQIYRLPVEVDIEPQDAEFNLLNIAARLYPCGQKISAAATVDRIQSRVAVNVDTAGLNLGCLADIAGRIADLSLAGEVSLHAKLEALWAPLRIASISAALTLRHGKIAAGGLEFQNVVSPQSREIPWQVDLVGTANNQWRVTCGKLSMAAPLPLTLNGIDAVIKSKAAAFESSGNFNVILPSSDQTGLNPWPVKIRDPLPMQGRFSAVYQNPAKWQFEISNSKTGGSPAKAVRLDIEPYTISFAPPDLNLAAEAASQRIEATYTLTAPEVRIDSAADSLYIPRAVLKGTAGLAEADESAARITFDLQAPNTGLKSDGIEIKIPEISVSGKLNRDDRRHIRLAGVMQFAGAGGKLSGLNTRLNGARAKIPFKWPVEGKTDKGSLAIAGLLYKDMNLGGMTGSIRQTPTGFAFEGQHQSALVPNLKLDFTGESRLFNVAARSSNVRVMVTRPGSAPEIDLEAIFPEAKGFHISGKFDLNGDFVLDDRGFNGNLRADLNEGRILSPQNKLALEGIRMSLNFPELPKIRSAPGGKIQFTKFSLGDLTAEKGSVDFQIESASSFLIEKMQFLWCDGHVETQSMRLSPGIEDYRITFYCDRLDLAKVLEQFGAAAAEGRGTVNGRIPLRYANGKISFDDGFLFSTPGDGGKIRITGSESLTAGIPPDTPQYVQMELASEALKDYDYSWAKLNITSQGEDLLLQMQMDGKPAKTLPFVYRKDIGGFAKVEADVAGSKFQGIRLDVNFRLPLNKLLQYKSLINMMKKSD
jgi:prepilin-type processing-associated H-X9-DG protein